MEITDNSGNTIIEGTIVMNATFNNVQLFDDYKIKIEILDSYPQKLPLVYETSGRIPKEFEHFLCEGALCLGVENDMWDKFLLNPTLLYYVNEFVIGYLYSVSFFIKYGTFPFGERAHGIDGIIEYYLEKLELSDIQSVFNVLASIYIDRYRGHQPCPCGSEKKTRDCHGKTIMEAITSGHKDVYRADTYSIYQYLEEKKNGNNSSTKKSFRRS